ncbi:MAG TPA: threonine synthase [Patescibacteria group bacterium]
MKDLIKIITRTFYSSSEQSESRSSRQARTINLGQGNTPLIRLFNLEQELNWQGELWAKCEYQNPTGSFKDRGSVTEILEALKQKKKGVVCASTGNMAASLSAYAARVGLPCIVVVPKGTPQSKLQQALIAGAQLIEVNGNYDVCVGKAQQIAKNKNYLLCGDYEIRRIGQQSIGEELAKSEIKFDAFICPVGNGTVGTAVAEGFAKYKKFPCFFGVQGKGADPLTISFEKTLSPIIAMEKPKTIASAMNVGNPLDGEITLTWVRKTNGAIFSVTDEEILAARKLLAQTEGIYVEPSAAATVAVLEKLPNRTMNLVIILTGHGLKGGV